MVVITFAEELLDAVCKCRDKPNYMVMIVFSDVDRRNEFMEECKASDLPFRINVRKGTMVLKNGSCINVYVDYQVKNCNAEYNQIILDGYFNKNWLESFVYPLLVPYGIDQPNEAFEDFLNDFRIKEENDNETCE